MMLHRRNKSDILAGATIKAGNSDEACTRGLPNIRIKKFQKQPSVYRSLNNQEANLLLHNKLSELAALEERSELDEYSDIFDSKVKLMGQTNSDFKPGITNKTFLKFDPDIKDELLKISSHMKFKHKRAQSYYQNTKKVIRPVTPTLDFEQTKMPIDLAIMAQVRRGLMNEIKKKNVGNLTMEKLDELKRNLIPETLKNIENSSKLYVEKVMQKQKEKDEMLSRNPLGNATYNIFALGKKSKYNLKKTLYSTLPDGSRFIQQKLFG